MRPVPRPGSAGIVRCYQCARHDLLGRGWLADAVVPISYAVKGTAFADGLWRYKSWPGPDAAAQTSMRALLLAFLHDHGACVWRHAGMPAPGRWPWCRPAAAVQGRTRCSRCPLPTCGCR